MQSLSLRKSIEGQRRNKYGDSQGGGYIPNRSLWDATFDQGLVSFGDDGRVLVSSQLSESARMALDLGGAPRLMGLRDAHRTNLAVHRARNGFALLDGLANQSIL